ncbi:MAG TPA: ABC transporter permease [Trebonia sp.]|jgi:ABC-type transport system involved in multi-copper enzyme maturation permease subunit
MATTTTADVKLSALPPATGQARLRGVLASEFTKLRSVRSTYWTIGALLVFGVGLAAAIGAGAASDLHNNPGDKVGFDATQTSLAFFFYIGQLIIAVLGAMTITAEYSTGMIRTSLTAMPRRGNVFVSKLLVFTGVALVVSLVTSFLAFLVGQAVMSGTGVSASLSHSTTIPIAGRVSPQSVTVTNSVVVTPGHVLTAIIGTALLVTMAAVIAFGLGAIIRHTAGAIASAIGLLFVVPIIVQLLPSTWRFDILRFVPSAAGDVLSATVGDHPHLWSAWPQFAVTAIWAVVLVGIGAYLFRKRDA